MGRLVKCHYISTKTNGLGIVNQLNTARTIKVILSAQIGLAFKYLKIFIPENIPAARAIITEMPNNTQPVVTLCQPSACKPAAIPIAQIQNMIIAIFQPIKTESICDR